MRSSLRLAVLAGVLIGLSACQTTPEEPRIEYRTVPVPVSAGCVVQRPAPVRPLNEQVPQEQWNALAPGAKAEAMRAQAGDRLNYENRLEAATSGCKDAEPQR